MDEVSNRTFVIVDACTRPRYADIQCATRSTVECYVCTNYNSGDLIIQRRINLKALPTDFHYSSPEKSPSLRFGSAHLNL